MWVQRSSHLAHSSNCASIPVLDAPRSSRSIYLPQVSAKSPPYAKLDRHKRTAHFCDNSSHAKPQHRNDHASNITNSSRDTRMKKAKKSTAKAALRIFTSLMTIFASCFAFRSHDEEDTPISHNFTPMQQGYSSSHFSMECNNDALRKATREFEMDINKPSQPLALISAKVPREGIQRETRSSNGGQPMPFSGLFDGLDEDGLSLEEEESVDEVIDITGLSPPISQLRNMCRYWEPEEFYKQLKEERRPGFFRRKKGSFRRRSAV